MEYEEIRDLSPQEVEAILRRDDPGELLHVPISVGLNADDLGWAQEVCIGMASHVDERVRGNALLGLGHLARVHGALDQARVQPLLEAGLRDASAWVRGQAHAAVEDVEHFLGWRLGIENLLRDWFEGQAVRQARFRLNDLVQIIEGEHAGELASVIWWCGPDEPTEYYIELGRDGSDVMISDAALRAAEPGVAADSRPE